MRRLFIFTLLLSLLFAFSCKKQNLDRHVTVYNVIEPGNHSTTIGKETGRFTGDFITAEICMCDCPYEYGDSNQQDYNKREGMTYRWWNPHWRNIMTADRWNPDLQVHEITFYNHGIVRGSNEYFSPGSKPNPGGHVAKFVLEPILQVRAGECYNLERDIHQRAGLIVTRIWNESGYGVDSVWFDDKLSETFYFQNAYHGGTYASPIRRELFGYYTFRDR